MKVGCEKEITKLENEEKRERERCGLNEGGSERQTEKEGKISKWKEESEI